MPQGIFITFEGGEGCGKTTQVELLVDALRQQGKDVLLVHEPGGTQLGEQIRSLLLARQDEEITPLAELLLYEASRAQIMEQVICPALEAGKVIVCDRFIDSTVAYQGYGRELGPELVKQLNERVIAGIYPHRTILLQFNPDEGLQRACAVTGGDGCGDRIEAAGSLFHHRVAQGFEELAKKDPQRIRTINANQSIEQVQHDVWDALKDLFEGTC